MRTLRQSAATFSFAGAGPRLVCSLGLRRSAIGIATVLACTGLSRPAPAHASQATTYFRGASSATTGSTTASSLDLGAPTAIVPGDLMILEIDATGSTAIATPTGWTSLGAATSNIGYYRVAYKIATSGDVGASYTLGLATARQAVARIVAFLGVDTASPIEASAFDTGTGTTGTFAPITTTVVNSYVLTGTAASLAGSLPAITPLSGTESLINAADTAATWLATNESVYSKSGAASTGSTSSTVAPSSSWRTSNIAIQPATSGALQFGIAPSLPTTFGSLTLDGQAQTLSTAMTNFDVDDTTG
jgi:hypothetical protein